MNSFDANVVIHINENLTDQEIQEMEKNLADIQGLVSACVHKNTRHLMVVDYDPRQTRSGELLHYIQNNGYRAQLVY
jgi:hypothetical protein